MIDDEPTVTVDDDTLPLSEAREHARASLAEFNAWAAAIGDVERANMIGRARPAQIVDEFGIDREALLNAAEDGELASADVDEHGRVHSIDRAEVVGWQIAREIAEADL